MKISAILLAAGEGRRLKKSVPKSFVKIQKKEMFLHSLEIFEKHPQIFEIILVVPKLKISVAKKLTTNFKKVSSVVGGGNSRMESLAVGLKFAKNEFILSQNAANPFVTAGEILKCVKFLKKWKAVGVGQRANSTVRMNDFSANLERINSKTLNREKVWLMETPQIVEKRILEKGLRIAKRKKIEATDELQLAELAGIQTKVVMANSRNFKITESEDLGKIPKSKLQITNKIQISNSKDTERRIGLGHDSHKFSQKKKSLILGGIQISKEGGLAANSDGDVILHALTNAISSALGGGSFSTFADGMCHRGIRDSKKYLKVIFEKMRTEDFAIENLAISIEGKRPKLEKHFSKIRKNLSGLLEIDSKKIGLTATSGEGLTAFGRGEGIQVFVIMLLKKAE